MNPDQRKSYETYQRLMAFLCEELQANNWSVMRFEKVEDETYPVYLQGDDRENLVRAFLNLPTVQHDRAEADRLVKDIQAKANRK